MKIIFPSIVIATAIAGVIVMKRIEPDNNVYPIYACVIVGIFLTASYFWF